MSLGEVGLAPLGLGEATRDAVERDDRGGKVALVHLTDAVGKRRVDRSGLRALKGGGHEKRGGQKGEESAGSHVSLAKVS